MHANKGRDWGFKTEEHLTIAARWRDVWRTAGILPARNLRPNGGAPAILTVAVSQMYVIMYFQALARIRTKLQWLGR